MPSTPDPFPADFPAEELVKVFTARGMMFAGAESCTAGLAADMIARVPGASNALWGSFVTYTAEAKIKMLGVPKELIETHGAVSRPVALAMAEGAREKSGALWAFSVTGLAGPGGDGNSPVGTVWIAVSGPGEGGSWANMFRFSGSRNEVREAAAIAALTELLNRVRRSE
jgi:PncC family amidohydrolase